MNNMRIISTINNYSIYGNKNYYLCVPNNNNNFYHLFMSFSLLDLTTLSEEELVMEIRKIGDSINCAYSNAIYVLPIVKPDFLKEAALENDDRLYDRLLKKIIQPITVEVHKIFSDRNVRISQIIKFIKQNDVDKKIVGWISMKLGNGYVREIVFDADADVGVNIQVDVQTPKDVITIDYEVNDVWLKKQEDAIMDTLKPAISFGFSSMKFMIMMIIIFLVVGAILGYMILK